MKIAFILAQILGFASCLVLNISAHQKTQKKVMLYQIIDCICSLVGTIILGGVTGAITTLAALVRNILRYTGKLRNWIVYFLMVSISIMGVVLSKSIIDILPVLASVSYTYGLKYTGIIITKKFLAVDCLLWCIYNISIRAYVGAVFSMCVTLSCCYYIIKDKYTKKGSVVV